MKIRFQLKHGKLTRCGTGKGFFIQRLVRELQEFGLKVTDDPDKKVDIDVAISKPLYEPKNTGRRVVRRGPVEYSTRRVGVEGQNKLERRYMRKCHGVIYQSRFSKAFNDKMLGKCHEKHAIIYNGCGYDEVHDACAQWPMAQHNFLASTREWVLEKNLKGIIESFLLADIPDSRLFILGMVWDKPKRFADDQKRYEKKYGSHRIAFMGPQPPQIVMSAYRMATAMIHMVHWDAQANAVAEALTCGCPVICGDQCGTMEVIKEGCGIVVPFKKHPRLGYRDRTVTIPVDKKRIAEALWHYAENPMRVTNNLHVDIKVIARKYLDFFEEVLG